MTRVTTLIIATFALLGGLASLTAGPCSVMTNGPCDRFVFGPPPPVIFDVDVTEAVDPATLDASDFTVNGIPADTVALTNGDMTISFHFDTSPARQGALLELVISLPASAVFVMCTRHRLRFTTPNLTAGAVDPG